MIITTTFSPMMLNDSCNVQFMELHELEDVKNTISLLQATGEEIISAVGHENTAVIISQLLGIQVPFARVNLTLKPHMRLLCITPYFRANEAREFTKEEVEGAGFRAFLITILPEEDS